MTTFRADPRSPGAVVPPGATGKDAHDMRKKDPDRTRRNGSSYGRDAPTGTGAPTSSSKQTTPRPLNNRRCNRTKEFRDE